MALEVRLYDSNLSSPTLVQELTEKVSGLTFSTGLNGGFKTCGFKLSMPVAEAWNWLSREGKRGYHFYRLTIHDERVLVWEGRIMDIQLQISGAEQSISVTAVGYWSACHDQFHTPTTNWKSGSGHFMHEVVAEILTSDCPDINSDQSGLDEADVDLVGLDITAKEYPQRRINQLVKLSSSDHAPWFFAIWDDRKPYLFKRNVTQIDWRVWLDSFTNLRLNQSALDLRNSVIPVKGATDGTAVDHTLSLTLYPRREVRFTLPTDTNNNNLEDAASMFANESGFPRQKQGFQISGKVYRSTAASGGRLEEVPKYLIRAGQTIRIQDLVPSSATIALDDVRTFYIMETSYNADSDTLTIQPDRRARRITSVITENVELNR